MCVCVCVCVCVYIYIYGDRVLYKFCREDEKKKYNKIHGRHVSIGTY